MSRSPYSVFGLMVLVFIVAFMVVGCADRVMAPPPADGLAQRVLVFPDEDGSWAPGDTMRGRFPTESSRVSIRDIGLFAFDPSDVVTVRPDIFVDGHFSLFDVVVHLHELGYIELEYHFNDEMGTHVIDSINGRPNWWYTARYAAGWFENTVLRMDHYPWKDGTELRVTMMSESYLDRINRSYLDEMQRLAINNGQVIVPEVVISDPTGTKVFHEVAVTAYGVRSDVLQEGVITALDILLSLGEQGLLETVGLTWYDSIGRADPVDNYFVERIDDAEAFGGCGYVYEVGEQAWSGHAGNHVHVATDVRVIVSPEYGLWFWLCL